MPIHLVNEPPTIIYYHRLHSLGCAVVRQCEDVFARTAEAAGDEYYRRASPDIHAIIDAALTNAGNIKKLLRPGRPLRKEPAEVLAFRERRVKALNALLDGVELSEIFSTAGRDSIEHFDEYLDREIVAGGSDPDATPVFAAYNLVVAKAEMFPFRLYDATEHKYYNFDAVVDLRKLQSEAAAIVSRLDERGVLGSSQSAGALIFPLLRRRNGAA